MFRASPARPMSLRRRVTIGLAASVMAACRSEPKTPEVALSARTGPAPPGRVNTTFSDDGQWLRPAKDYASTRFSGLSEINTNNVKGLRVVATFSTGVVRGHEAAPVVAGATMYVVTPYPNTVFALDLTKPGL